MTNSLSTTDRAAVIRAALKTKGWTSRDVSVKSHYYSMGSSIYVVIKNHTVPLSVVEEIANQHERIDRCQISGEILSGCNRYVSVNYSHEATELIGAPWTGAVEAALATLSTASENSLIDIAGTPYSVGNSSNGWGFSVWQDSHLGQFSTAKGVAEFVGVKMLEASVAAVAA